MGNNCLRVQQSSRLRAAKITAPWEAPPRAHLVALDALAAGEAVERGRLKGEPVEAADLAGVLVLKVGQLVQRVHLAGLGCGAAGRPRAGEGGAVRWLGALKGAYARTPGEDTFSAPTQLRRKSLSLNRPPAP